MTRGDISTTGILNAAVPHLRRAAAPAAGVLLLTSLPLRLLQLHFIDVLHRLRGDAPYYGNLLIAYASLIVVSFLIAIYGRAVFMRACRETPETWRELLGVGTTAFLTYAYVALMIELAFVFLCITVIVIPFAIMLAGVAAAASTDAPEPGIVMPLRNLAPYLRHGRVLAGLMFVFGVAYLAVAINVALLAAFLVWAAGGIPGWSSASWSVAMPQSFRFNLAVFFVAATILEPFFLSAMHVYGDRVRSRRSGDDLIRRFRTLTARKAAVAAAIVCALLSTTTIRADDASITTAQYVAGLRTTRDALAAGRYSDVTVTAAELLSVRWVVTEQGSRFEPDRALVRDADRSASERKPGAAIVQRLTSTIDAFDGPEVAASQSPPDPALLARIREGEKLGELMRGGELKQMPMTDPSIGEYLRDIFRRVIDWLAAKLEGFFDWLARLWPKRGEDDDATSAFFGVPVVVWVVTLLIVAVLALLAVYVLRRSKRRAAMVQSEHVSASERDDDPLSRESNEWERYAAELAASGRFREAIRAWYHAVLVTLYRAGILHYRKGATNWEYIGSLSPGFEWRPHFISMTRRFDREWYGRHETTADVLDACASDARLILDTIGQGAR